MLLYTATSTQSPQFASIAGPGNCPLTNIPFFSAKCQFDLNDRIVFMTYHSRPVRGHLEQPQSHNILLPPCKGPRDMGHYPDVGC